MRCISMNVGGGGVLYVFIVYGWQTYAHQLNSNIPNASKTVGTCAFLFVHFTRIKLTNTYTITLTLTQAHTYPLNVQR